MLACESQWENIYGNMTKEEIYFEIGKTIADSINEAWEFATLDVCRLNKYTSVKGFYINKNGEEKAMDDSNFGYLFSIKIHDLYIDMAKEKENPWNKLKFLLYPSGKFEIDFIWDQKYQDEVDKLNK